MSNNDINEKQFSCHVCKCLKTLGFDGFSPVTSSAAVSEGDMPSLQPYFYNFNRDSTNHHPDFTINTEDYGIYFIETKSPKELYSICRYSKAHLISYITQIITGQCYSYVRKYCNETKRIVLIVPKEVETKTGYENMLLTITIDSLIDKLTMNCSPAVENMGFINVNFGTPDFLRIENSKLSITENYCVFEDEETPVLFTELKYSW